MSQYLQEENKKRKDMLWQAMNHTTELNTPVSTFIYRPVIVTYIRDTSPKGKKQQQNGRTMPFYKTHANFQVTSTLDDVILDLSFDVPNRSSYCNLQTYLHYKTSHTHSNILETRWCSFQYYDLETASYIGHPRHSTDFTILPVIRDKIILRAKRAKNIFWNCITHFWH